MVWKEIYVVKDGLIVLEKIIQGVHTPSRAMPETIEFEEEDD